MNIRLKVAWWPAPMKYSGDVNVKTETGADWRCSLYSRLLRPRIPENHAMLCCNSDVPLEWNSTTSVVKRDTGLIPCLPINLTNRLRERRVENGMNLKLMSVFHWSYTTKNTLLHWSTCKANCLFNYVKCTVCNQQAASHLT